MEACTTIIIITPSVPISKPRSAILPSIYLSLSLSLTYAILPKQYYRGGDDTEFFWATESGKG